MIPFSLVLYCVLCQHSGTGSFLLYLKWWCHFLLYFSLFREGQASLSHGHLWIIRSVRWELSANHPGQLAVLPEAGRRGRCPEEKTEIFFHESLWQVPCKGAQAFQAGPAATQDYNCDCAGECCWSSCVLILNSPLSVNDEVTPCCDPIIPFFFHTVGVVRAQ